MTIPHGKLVKTGDLVVALIPGDKDPQGRPHSAPKRGEVCRVTDIYPVWYGLGCTLEGKDPGPYKGFKLWEKAHVRGRHQSRSFFKVLPKDGDLEKKLRVKNRPNYWDRMREKEEDEVPFEFADAGIYPGER